LTTRLAVSTRYQRVSEMCQTTDRGTDGIVIILPVGLHHVLHSFAMCTHYHNVDCQITPQGWRHDLTILNKGLFWPAGL